MAGRGGESERHRELKKLALIWAQARGFAACAVEVALPRSSYRADVAACGPAGRDGAPGETAVFECKQARADLLRDSADERATSERLREVRTRRRELEALVGAHLPDLRRGVSLFAECDVYDFGAIRHEGLREVWREEGELQAKLFGATKFARVRRYRCADRCYLVVSAGVLLPHEAPAGWGVLETADNGATLTLVRRPERIESGSPARLAMLQAIAMAARREVFAALGVTREAIDEARRDAAAEI